jgi:hypothetical protein
MSNSSFELLAWLSKTLQGCQKFELQELELGFRRARWGPRIIDQLSDIFGCRTPLGLESIMQREQHRTIFLG